MKKNTELSIEQLQKKRQKYEDISHFIRNIYNNKSSL